MQQKMHPRPPRANRRASRVVQSRGAAPGTDWIALDNGSERPSRRLPARSPLGHRLIKPHPYFDGGEFDECEIVFGMFFEAHGDDPEVFDFVEEALDAVAISVEEGAECRLVLSDVPTA